MINFKNKLNIIVSDKKFEFFLFVSFAVIFSSINTKPNHFYDANHTIFGLINYLRFTLPFLLIFPLIYFNLKLKKINKLICFFLFFLSCQVVGALLNIKLIGSNIEYFYLILDALAILLVFNLIDHRLDLYNKFFKITFVILFFSFLITFSKYISNYFTEPSFFLYDFKDFYSLKLMETTLAHSTGVSRVGLFLFIFLTLYLLIYRKFFTYLFLINIFLLSIIWGYQSRGTIIMFLIFCFFLILINFYKKINFKLYLIPLNIFLSLILWEIIFVSKSLIYYEGSPKENIIFNFTTIKNNRFYSTIERHFKVTQNRNFTVTENRDTNSKPPIINFKSKDAEIIKPYYNVNDSPLTSGRIIIWKRIFDTYDYEKFFGYGFQGDRFVLRKLNKENTTYGSNSSNGYLYALVSGGYFAFLIFFIINILAIKIVFIFIKKSNVISDVETKFYGFVSSSFIILILARSLIENSHSVFGIDFIIFVLCVLYINKINNSLKSL